MAALALTGRLSTGSLSLAARQLHCLAVAAAAIGQRAVPSSLNDHAAQARFKYDGTCRWPYQAASLSAFTLALPNQCSGTGLNTSWPRAGKLSGLWLTGTGGPAEASVCLY